MITVGTRIIQSLNGVDAGVEIKKHAATTKVEAAKYTLVALANMLNVVAEDDLNSNVSLQVGIYVEAKNKENAEILVEKIIDVVNANTPVKLTTNEL